MRSVTSTASVDLPFIFLRALGLNQTTLRASAKATRRDVNIMIVMDRSKSLADSGACTPLKAAAVKFVDKFAEGRATWDWSRSPPATGGRAPDDNFQNVRRGDVEQPDMQRRH